MQRILGAIEEKRRLGYGTEQLEVDYGYIGDGNNRGDYGYYLSKINDWGASQITNILAKDGEIDEGELIQELDRKKIAYCLK